MSHIFPRHSQMDMPMIAKGAGCYLIDTNGKRYFDGSGGAAVSCLGHNDPDVVARIQAQMAEISFAHTGFFTTDVAEKLADLLIAKAPTGLDRVFLVSGGSEAVEAALKLARQYFVEIGQPSRHHIIARYQSYHGNTLGALAAGGNMWRRQPFAPMLIDTSHIAPCYAYRGQAQGESAWDYGQRVAEELNSEIQRLGAENVMAFIAEPVVGATLGAVPAVDGYFKRIREICDSHGILLILDEVMCGMGRTGDLFACAHDGISPDIVTIAKGLGAGYQPIGAMLCQKKIYDAIAAGSGFFQHGHTYLGHALGCAAGLGVMEAIYGRDLLSNVKRRGNQLAQALRDKFGNHPHIGDIRGRGLFLGLELVVERRDKTPFDPSLSVAKKIKAAAMAEGLLCYPMSGTLDGQRGDHILLAPPFIITEDHIAEMVTKLARAIDQAIAL